MFDNSCSKRIPIPEVCCGNLFFFAVPKIKLQLSFACGRALEGLVGPLLFSECATSIYSSVVDGFK